METDLGALRRQLRQLKALFDEGAISEEAHRQGRETLERRIVDAVMSGASDEHSAAAAAPASFAATAAVDPPAARRSRGLTIGVIGGVLLLAAAGYWWTGSPQMASAPWPSGTAGDAVGTAPAAGGASAPHALGTDQVLAMINKLSQRLQEAPSDAEGWAMLGRSYAVIGRHADALPAYEKAVALRADDASLLADYADALAVVNKHELTGEPLALVNQALKLDPDNLKALSLAGTAAFNRKDYAGAVKHWEHIAAVAPAGSSYLPQVESNLAEARELGKLPTPAVPSAAAASAAPNRVPAATAAGASVSGTVSLAAALRSRAAPSDTVFVFARAAEGPRMPLAILRKQVKDLPFDFKLDDSLAMSPAMRLSAHSKVVVGARVSKSGDAMPQPGDLSGQTGVIELGAGGLKIEISQAVTAP